MDYATVVNPLTCVSEDSPIMVIDCTSRSMSVHTYYSSGWSPWGAGTLVAVGLLRMRRKMPLVYILGALGHILFKYAEHISLGPYHEGTTRVLGLSKRSR